MDKIWDRKSFEVRTDKSLTLKKKLEEAKEFHWYSKLKQKIQLPQSIEGSFERLKDLKSDPKT